MTPDPTTVARQLAEERGLELIDVRHDESDAQRPIRRRSVAAVPDRVPTGDGRSA